MNTTLPLLLPAAFALSAATTQAQLSPPTYHVRDMGPLLAEVLPPVTWPGSIACGLNEDGDLIGQADLDGGQAQSFLYTVENGITLLPNISGWSSTAVRDVSDRDANGEVVIVGCGAYGVHTDIAIGPAAMWRVSTVTGQLLETRVIGVLPGYDEAMATGVNSNGIVVGFCNLNFPTAAFKYDIATDTLEEFPFPAKPVALNENDEVVGGPYLGDLFGNYVHVGDPPQMTTGGLQGLNDLGSVCGVAATGQTDGAGHWLVAAVYKHLGVWGNFPVCCWTSSARDINNHGDVITGGGSLHLPSTGQDYGVGTLYAPEFFGVYGMSLTAAINDNLQIAGRWGDALLVTPLGVMIIPGDVNGDAEVDLDDYCAWVAAPIDLDGDGDVDPSDEAWLIDRLSVFGFFLSDCNGNGVEDHCEVSSGAVSDCNENGVPDLCEGDCNADGVPDVCEPDCNSNGVPDPCDIQQGTSPDCNANGIPDECDGGGETHAEHVFDPPLPMYENMVLTDELFVVAGGTVADVDFELALSYRIGELSVFLSHGGVTVTLIDRPGIPETSLGNGELGYDIVLDDEGTGGPIEDEGNFGPPFDPIVSPPSYTPDEPLSAFDGLPVEGVWTVTVTTSPGYSPPAARSFFSWGLTVTAAGADLSSCFTPLCIGTGSACPCGNAGAGDAGCENSAATGGGLLAGAGAAIVSGDTLTLTATGLPALAPVLFFQGTTALGGGTGQPFGDGLQCAGGAVVRLQTKTAAGGAASYPEAGDPAVSIRGQVPAIGGTRVYQAWYRDTAPFCSPAGFNLSNGLEVIWAP